MKITLFVLALMIAAFGSCQEKDSNEIVPKIAIESVFINDKLVPNQTVINEVDFRNVEIRVAFNTPVDTKRFNRDDFFLSGFTANYHHRFDPSRRWLYIKPSELVNPLSFHRLTIFPGQNLGGTFSGDYSFGFRTRLDSTPKFPKISDEELLTLVQRQTFRFFWDYAHPCAVS